MDESILVHGSPDLKMPRPGRNAHGVRSVGDTGTLLAVAECFIGDDTSAQLTIEAAMSAYDRSKVEDRFERARDAIKAADAHLRGRGNHRCALALVSVEQGRACVVWVGPIRVLHLKGKEIVSKTVDNKELVGGTKNARPPVVHMAEAIWPLEQSDRLLMWTSPVFECVEETLLPNLLENRPPDRCVASVLKLANYRGLTDDYAMLVAAWQDPELATFAEAFRADVNYDDKTTGGHMPREGFPDAEFAILTDDTFTADVVGPRDPSIPQGKAAAPSSESSSTTALAVGALVVGLVAIAIATAGMYFILI